jgi:uncharacterized membrane protein (UPF0127 family)
MPLVFRRTFLILLFAALVGLLPHRGAAAPTTDLVIVSAGGPHAFKVELATTDTEKAQGLMYRRELAPDAGMLFDMGPGEHEATFWMKNTFIPLDMLFIRADGSIQNIAERTVPQSLATVPSDGPVRAVLEVNGGTAARLGIKPGDKVRHRLFGNSN